RVLRVHSMLSYLLYVPVAPLALPSFPTRRSSDLSLLRTVRLGLDTVPGQRTFTEIADPRTSATLRTADHQRRLRQTIRGIKGTRSEEPTSELQSREISYAVFCLKKKKKTHE